MKEFSKSNSLAEENKGLQFWVENSRSENPQALTTHKQQDFPTWKQALYLQKNKQDFQPRNLVPPDEGILNTELLENSFVCNVLVSGSEK